MSPQSLATRIATTLPPVRRVYSAINDLNRAVRDLQAWQSVVEARRSDSGATPADADGRLSARLDHVTEGEALDAATRREIGEAALRNLPFLPGSLDASLSEIAVSGICGAPDGLTGETAFFINGHRIADVEYPIADPMLDARYPELKGRWFHFRLRVRDDLEARMGERFWRFDAAPLGCYDDTAWRRAIHFMNPTMERFAFPPAVNMRRVIGDDSPARFGMGGATIFNNAARLLGTLGLAWDDVPRILDWGCGCGRLTRYLIDARKCEVTGIDIDPDNIEWCRETYSGGTFEVVPLRPPTSFAGERFDLVFGLSVMTHLSEPDQDAWLEELHRLTRPGAILLLSIQGPTQFAINGFPPATYRRVQEEGYVNLQRDPALDAVIPDRDYYRSAMHSREYIVARWSRGFDVLGFADAVAALQDFVILRRRAN